MWFAAASKLVRMGAGAMLALVIGCAADQAGAGEHTGAMSPVPVPRLQQKILQRFDVPGTTYEAILMRVEFPANYDVSRHAHPGPEASFVMQGQCTYLFDGQTPQVREAGESIELPAYAVHGAKAGPEGAVLINTFILEKGKPLSIPAED